VLKYKKKSRSTWTLLANMIGSRVEKLKADFKQTESEAGVTAEGNVNSRIVAAFHRRNRRPTSGSINFAKSILVHIVFCPFSLLLTL